jgi:hypothetical protein
VAIPLGRRVLKEARGACSATRFIYLSRAIDDLKAQGVPVDDNLLEHISPLGWEHINLTGDTSDVRTGVW